MKLRDFYAGYASFAFGVTEGDAYELQRVLQNIKGFDRGRPGPGGGALARPFSVAIIVIAMLAGGTRRRAKETVTEYYEMNQEGAELVGWVNDFVPKVPACPFTGERQFGPALKRILDTPQLAERLHEIAVTRDWPEATITYRDGATTQQSRFVDEIERLRATRHRRTGALRTVCTLGGEIVHQLAIDLNETDDDEWTSSP